MKNKLFLVIVLLFLLQIKTMADAGLPIDTLSSKDATKPLVVYITGDGGFNSFSTTFMQQWNKKGYPVVALNAKSYFWKTKAPEAAARDIADLMIQYMVLWKRNDIILVGYSLGADVLPFIQTRLPSNIVNRIKHTVLLSPSGNTDFTVHLFYSSNGGSSVPAEINKLDKPTLIVFGNKESDVSTKQINNKLVTIVTVAGDHHYNNQIADVANEIIRRVGM